MPSSRTTRRTATGVAAIAAVAMVVLLAIPSVGSIGSSVGNGSAVVNLTMEDLGLSVAAHATSPAQPSSQQSGAVLATAQAPYPVASLTATLIDPSRTTAARGSRPATSERSIAVTIYYPVTGTLGSAQFPLVVFAHGFGASAATYEDMEADLAAAGFVVAAPDFPLSSGALDGDAMRDIVDQAVDVSFVITSLLVPTTQPAELIALIAPTQVAVIGHSDGGVTAAGVAYNDEYVDPRIGAAVILSGAEAFFPGAWFDAGSPALLAIHGTADELNPFGASQTLYTDAVGVKWLVGVTDGSHSGPFTTDAVRTEVSALVADFLRATLSADATAAARLDGDANAPGLLLLGHE